MEERDRPDWGLGRAGQNSEEAEGRPKPQLGDGRGTWPREPERGCGGTERPEGGFLPGNHPDRWQGWGCGRPSSCWEPPPFLRNAPHPEGVPAPGASARQHPPSSARLCRGQRPVLFGATAACPLPGAAGDGHGQSWPPWPLRAQRLSVRWLWEQRVEEPLASVVHVSPPGPPLPFGGSGCALCPGPGPWVSSLCVNDRSPDSSRHCFPLTLSLVS